MDHLHLACTSRACCAHYILRSDERSSCLNSASLHCRQFSNLLSLRRVNVPRACFSGVVVADVMALMVIQSWDGSTAVQSSYSYSSLVRESSNTDVVECEGWKTLKFNIITWGWRCIRWCILLPIQQELCKDPSWNNFWSVIPTKCYLKQYIIILMEGSLVMASVWV